MKCSRLECEANGCGFPDCVDVEALFKENQALRDELEAVKAGMNKIKADAIRETIKRLEHDCNGWAKDENENVYWHDKQILRVADEVEKGQ